LIKLKESSQNPKEVDHLKTKVKESEKRENTLTSHLKEIFEYLNNIEVKFNRRERRLEEEIISLKTQLEEAKRMEEVTKN
jgi:hypothetical protein